MLPHQDMPNTLPYCGLAIPTLSRQSQKIASLRTIPDYLASYRTIWGYIDVIPAPQIKQWPNPFSYLSIQLLSKIDSQ